MAKIRSLYPIEFQRRFTVFDGGTYVADEPWPLDFTREGLEAGHLRLGDTATASDQAWSEFSGVYSYFPVRGPKPGATVLAYFSDPRTGQGNQLPVYFAEQFYGSGRVFYAASGEMWRLRREGDALFERFYTRLVRHVSQGRLLRQSSRGALLVGQDRYAVGSTVEIRARLTNARFAPLEATGVAMDVFAPNGRAEPLTLRPDPSRSGVITGQFTVLAEGTYRLELAMPQSDDERLTRYVKVSLPDLERQDPQRNDKLLSRIAQATGGRYYAGLEAAFDSEEPDRLAGQLKDRTKTIIQTGVVEPPTLRWLLKERLPPPAWRLGWVAWLADESWLRRLLDQTLIWWLMIIACGFLFCEWLIRRLAKLA
ncbi:MAG: hypothetical protein HQ582_30915 [Planctomycetes bacterium]|nr:hypothetical protein [Planctomycetota bacterium]